MMTTAGDLYPVLSGTGDFSMLDAIGLPSLLPSPTILIGHSMGGYIIQKYLEDHTSPGAVLLSSPPPTGFLPATLRIAWRRPLIFAKITLTLSLLPLVATPRLAREAFFSANFPDEDLLT